MRILTLTGSVLVVLMLASVPANAAGPLPSAPLPPANYIPPSIAGSAAEGSTVACTPGYWLNSPTGYVYSWQRNGTTTISGPSSNSYYTLTSSDVSQSITCTVTASNGSGSNSATSSPITPGPAPPPGVPTNESPPAIVGQADEGHTVTCATGAWLNNPSGYSYSWQRDGLVVSGQTGPDYQLTSADVNQLITCQVVASNASGASPPAVSPPILPGTGFPSNGASGSGGANGGAGSSGSNGASGGGGAGSGGRGSRGKLVRGRLARGPAPKLGVFSLSPRTLSVRGRGKRARTAGLTFRYSLDHRARLVILIEQRLAGRRMGKRCAAITRASKRRARCTRVVVLARLIVPNAKAGPGRLWYSGRFARGLLARGAYLAAASAETQGGWSKTRTARFRVVRK